MSSPIALSESSTTEQSSTIQDIKRKVEIRPPTEDELIQGEI